MNGRFDNDKSVGRFTFNGHSGQSVVDYILVSNELLETVSSFTVADPNILSDHCALHCSLLTYINESHNDDRNDHCEKNSYKYKWNDAEADTFKRLLSSDDAINAFNSIQTSFLSPHNDNDFIDSGISKFVEILEHCASPFHKHIFQTNNETDNSVKSQPWYTDIC